MLLHIFWKQKRWWSTFSIPGEPAVKRMRSEEMEETVEVRLVFVDQILCILLQSSTLLTIGVSWLRVLMWFYRKQRLIRNKSGNCHKWTPVRKQKHTEGVTYFQHITLGLDTYFREYLLLPGVSSSVILTGDQDEDKDESCSEKNPNNVCWFCKVVIKLASWCIL